MEWAPGVDTLLTASWLNDTYAVTRIRSTPGLRSRTRDTASGTILGVTALRGPTSPIAASLEIYSVEGQQIWQTHKFTTIVGARWQGGEFHTQNVQTNSDPNLRGLGISLAGHRHPGCHGRIFDRESVYGYEQWRPVDALEIIGGVSYDRLTVPQDFRFAPVSANSVTAYHLLPKGGVIWTPLKGTTIRAGYSKSVGGASFDQDFQIEPTQVAGFNQAFRSVIPEAVANANAGATFDVAGISLEQKLPTRTYLAIEGDLLSSRAWTGRTAFLESILTIWVAAQPVPAAASGWIIPSGRSPVPRTNWWGATGCSARSIAESAARAWWMISRTSRRITRRPMVSRRSMICAAHPDAWTWMRDLPRFRAAFLEGQTRLWTQQQQQR